MNPLQELYDLPFCLKTKELKFEFLDDCFAIESPGISVAQHLV